jgi:glycosyltransferase involved in cell wall biosynthesis
LPRLLAAAKKADVSLVMVGKALQQENIDKSNPWNKDLVTVQRLAKEDHRIIRLGFLPNEDLVMLYNTAEAFVFPSLYEGFGLPVLEAMACGCPVITTKEGSLPEVAGDAALYVDAYDVDNIAEGIRNVFSNKRLREELSEKGLEQAKKFSWKETARETLQVYEKLMQKK